MGDSLPVLDKGRTQVALKLHRVIRGMVAVDLANASDPHMRTPRMNPTAAQGRKYVAGTSIAAERQHIENTKMHF